jgi:hypothetical protein
MLELALEPITTLYFVIRSLQSAWLYVCSPIVARRQLGKNVTAATNTRNNIIIVGSFLIKVKQASSCSQDFLSKYKECKLKMDLNVETERERDVDGTGS